MIKEIIKKLLDAKIKTTETSIEFDFSENPISIEDLDFFVAPDRWAAMQGMKLGEKLAKEKEEKENK